MAETNSSSTKPGIRGVHVEQLLSAKGKSLESRLRPQLRHVLRIKPMLSSHAAKVVAAISASSLSIYDPIDRADVTLWIPTPLLEEILQQGLGGRSLAGLPLRTRSKVLRTHVCQVLGYPIPTIFKRSQPRFPGQDFDTYVQKSNNLQVWNEKLSASRRYVLIRVDDGDQITRVKVVSGEEISPLDTTGTLTWKYQASVKPGDHLELVTETDTENLTPIVGKVPHLPGSVTPVDDPTVGTLLPIADVFARLQSLVGTNFPDRGSTQERNRGGDLHKLVSSELGYSRHSDDGQFPDVRHQLLEVKLQTSPTIDLGLVTPDSRDELDCPLIGCVVIRHCDVRYAIFYGETNRNLVSITHLIVTTGEQFYTRFPKFQGNVLNKKIQIPLPSNFFD